MVYILIIKLIWFYIKLLLIYRYTFLLLIYRYTLLNSFTEMDFWKNIFVRSGKIFFFVLDL